MSIAAAVGFIALAGVAAEIGVVMLLYLNQAVFPAIIEGAALRVRPIAMTVAVVVAVSSVSVVCNAPRLWRAKL